MPELLCTVVPCAPIALGNSTTPPFRSPPGIILVALLLITPLVQQYLFWPTCIPSTLYVVIGYDSPSCYSTAKLSPETVSVNVLLSDFVVVLFFSFNFAMLNLYRDCLRDWYIQYLLIDVYSLTDIFTLTVRKIDFWWGKSMLGHHFSLISLLASCNCDSETCNWDQLIHQRL